MERWNSVGMTRPPYLKDRGSEYPPEASFRALPPEDSASTRTRMEDLDWAESVITDQSIKSIQSSFG